MTWAEFIEFVYPLYVFFGLPLLCALTVILGFFAYIICKAVIDVVILKKTDDTGQDGIT